MERQAIQFEIFDKDFWNNLEKLRHTLLIFSQKALTSDSSIDLALENKKDMINTNILKHECTSKDTSNYSNFHKDRGINLVKNPVLKTVGRGTSASSKRLVLLQHLLTKIYKLIETGSYKTKRELYYEDVNLYKSQSVVDGLLDDIACLLNVSKIYLHVLTTSKGCLAGRLRFKDSEGNYIDCSETARGILVPNNVQGISNIQSDARFILVVEKSAVYEMLIDNDVTSVFRPCIILTGKGFPDVNTREILRKLSDSLQIPILGLFDADPYGIEILGTYKYGSKAMAFDVKNLAVPEMRWLGLLPTDIQSDVLEKFIPACLEEFRIIVGTHQLLEMSLQKLARRREKIHRLPQQLKLPAESTIPLSENDKKKAHHLLALPYVRHHKQWLNEVQVMLKTEKKAEIEGLSKVGPTFLPSIYLPNKIKYGGWI